MNRNKNFKSIRDKLVFILSVTALIAIFISSVVLFWYTYDKNESNEIKTLSQTVSIMGENLNASLEFDDAEGAKSILSALKLSENIDGGYILKEDKTVFASYTKEGLDEQTVDKKISSLYAQNDIKREIEYSDAKNILVSKPLYLKDKYLASFIIVSNTKNIHKMLQTQLIMQIVTSVFVLLIIIFLAFKLQRMFTFPIFSLVSAMDEVRKNSNYDVKIYFRTNDEFQSLFDGFEEMLKTIKEQKAQLENYTQTLNETIKMKTADIEEQKHKLEASLFTLDKYVIFSRTDLGGKVTQVSDAFCKISGYSKEEWLGKSHNISRHPDMPKEVFKDLWQTIKADKVWKGEVKNLKKEGGYYWVDAIVAPEYNQEGERIGYNSIRQDITAKKAVEELSAQQAIQMDEIERSNRLLSGRENRMVELKEQINECRIKAGEEAPYAVVKVEDITIEETVDLNDREDANLSVLLDVEQLQSMMESFYKIMHIPLAIIDLEANILVQSKWQRACTDFHRANSESCKRCIESDIDMANKLEEGKNFTSYKCSNGLIDCASPIIVNGKHVANFFIGQFLINEPDMEFFTNQAKLFGYDVEDYIESIKDVPIVKEEMLPLVLGFLTQITSVITSISIEKLKSQYSENVNKIRATQMQKGQVAAMNLAEDAEKARLEIENYKEHLETLVHERTEELHEQKEFIQTVVDSQEQMIVTTNGVTILSANREFFDFYAVDSIDRFREIYKANCICQTFNTNAPEGYLQILMDNETWIDYVIARSHSNITHKAMITKDNIDYIFSVTAAVLPGNKGLKSAVFTNITEIETAKQEIELILANILLPVLITSKNDRKILYANKYAEIQYEKAIDEIVGSDIDSVYTVSGQHYHIVETIEKYGRVENMEETFRTSTAKEFTALLSVTPIKYKGEESYIGMVADITKQKEMENEVRAIHKHTRESIEYAALIQGALIPDNQIFRNFFQDYFAIWHPKDIVGGDIYLMNELNEDELILMVIDCTGHGVPGAFVTMLVKAIERQIMSNIHKDETISPAKILSIFNKSIKHLLKQESIGSVSNAGFDGGVIYYNKKEKILKYAGAETALFYMDENNELQTIKGSRHSIGYKKSDVNFEFKEHVIEAKEGMQFYCATDGYFDQNGGEKGFPFGRKKFSEILEEYHHESMAEQQEILLYKMAEYEKMVINNDRNDDMTVIGFKI